MLKRTGWIFVVAMISLLLLPGMAIAQDDAEARRTVLDAVEATNALDGYHLTVKSNAQNKITQSDGSVTATYTVQTVEGDIGQDGDRQFKRQLQSGENFENAVQSAPLVIEQIVNGGTTYVNFQTENQSIISMLNIQPGWWEYEKLLASSDSAVISTLIKQYSQSDTALENTFSDDTILNVEELESEIRDSINLRVFDIELDPLPILAQMSGATAEEVKVMLSQKAELVAASEITLKYRLWIGAEDGLVYRGKGEQRSYIPYGTAGTDSDPDFNLDASGASEFIISQHGELVDIQPPDPALLNE